MAAQGRNPVHRNSYERRASGKIVSVNLPPRALAVIRAGLSALLIGSIVFVYYKLVHVNPTTVALTFLLAILAVSVSWGLQFAVPMSVIAALCFNFFFLPPIGTFTIADTQNWVALIAFLCVSFIASNLSVRIKRQAKEATQRRREVERLYTFSQQLLITDNIVQLLKTVPSYIVETFGVKEAALHLADRDKIYRFGPDTETLQRDELREATSRGEFVSDIPRQRCFAPVRMGLRTLG